MLLRRRNWGTAGIAAVGFSSGISVPRYEGTAVAFANGIFRCRSWAALWCKVRHEMSGFIYEWRSRKKKTLGAWFQSLSSLKLLGGFAHLQILDLNISVILLCTVSELQQTFSDETSSSLWFLEFWSVRKRIVKWSYHVYLGKRHKF